MATQLLLKGGHVVDPSQRMNAPLDVAIADGRIAAIGSDLSPADGTRVVDVAGRVVTPGLIDLHAHLYVGVSDLGVDPDQACLARGVTTAVDVGSAGSITYPGFRDYVMARSRCRIYAFLHLASIGLVAHRVGELRDMAYADPEGCRRVIEENRDRILGVKIRMGAPMINGFGIEPLKLSLDVAERTGTKLMVHIGDSPVPLGEILDLMRPGDIVTHVLTGKPVENILDAGGQIIPELWKAVERGVWTDVGNGYGSFSFRVARAALAQGFKPDCLSTDLHTQSINGPVHDLPTVMSKFLALGMALDEVVERATINPARALGMGDTLGSLRVGSVADVAVFDLQEGEFLFWDVRHDRTELSPSTMTGRQRLVPSLTIAGGRIVEVQQQATVAGAV